jgi:hypothetical protein
VVVESGELESEGKMFPKTGKLLPNLNVASARTICLLPAKKGSQSSQSSAQLGTLHPAIHGL